MGCFASYEPCSVPKSPRSTEGSGIFSTLRQRTFVKPSSSSENSLQKRVPQLVVSARTMVFQIHDEASNNHQGEWQTAIISSTSTSPSSFQRSVEYITTHWSPDKVAVWRENESSNVSEIIDTVDGELMIIRKSDKIINYNPILTRSQSILGMVKPVIDHDEDKINDIVNEGDGDDIIEKLKNENVVKENRIQELLKENERLKANAVSRSSLLKRSKSCKFREKINDIRSLSRTSSLAFVPPRCIEKDRSDGIPKLQDIASAPLKFKSSLENLIERPEKKCEQQLTPLKFKTSLEELKKRPKKKCEQPLSREGSSNWSLCEFTLL